MESEDVVHGFFIQDGSRSYENEVIIMSFCFPSSFIFSRKVVSLLLHMPSSQIITSLTANFLVSNDIKKVNHLSPHFFTFFQSLETPLFIFLFPLIFIIIKITIPSIVLGSKNSYFLQLHLPSCYRTVCYRTVQ